jgi:hypothetical protein
MMRIAFWMTRRHWPVFRRGQPMTIRWVVLFTHVVGMLVLFIGIAFEWLSAAVRNYGDVFWQ